MIKQELEKIMADADKTVEAILGGKESIVLSAGRIMKDQKTILELGRMVIEMQHERKFRQEADAKLKLAMDVVDASRAILLCYQTSNNFGRLGLEQNLDSALMALDKWVGGE